VSIATLIKIESVYDCLQKSNRIKVSPCRRSEVWEHPEEEGEISEPKQRDSTGTIAVNLHEVLHEVLHGASSSPALVAYLNDTATSMVSLLITVTQSGIRQMIMRLSRVCTLEFRKETFGKRFGKTC
jgi:hypothetical protein